MRFLSRDVIEHLSQTRVISSERRYPSVGDMGNDGQGQVSGLRQLCVSLRSVRWRTVNQAESFNTVKSPSIAGLCVKYQHLVMS